MTYLKLQELGLTRFSETEESFLVWGQASDDLAWCRLAEPTQIWSNNSGSAQLE